MATMSENYLPRMMSEVVFYSNIEMHLNVLKLWSKIHYVILLTNVCVRIAEKGGTIQAYISVEIK